MSEDEEAEFEKCVTTRMSENPDMTREQAEVLCKPATEPEDQPTPPGGTLTDAEQSPYQKCISKYTSDPHNLSREEAIKKCKEEGVAKTDEDAAYENCVDRKMKEGKSREEAEKECRAEHPVGEGDQAEATPLEECIASRMEAEGETREQATEWCEAELAGEHQAADAIINRSQILIRQKSERDAEKAIQSRKERKS